MRPVPYYVLALAMALPAVLVGAEVPSWLTLFRESRALESDLRVFYTPGYMLRTGQRKDIYDFQAIHRNQDQEVVVDRHAEPYLHPSYEALIFMPLSLLRYRSAYLVWAAVNFSILGLITVLIRPHVATLSAMGPSWLLPGLLLGFIPIAFTIVEGQDSLLLLLVLVLVYRRIEGHEFEAGMLLGLGMFRFQVLLPIVALFMIWRSLKFVAGWIVSSAIVLSVSAVITGFSAQMQYVELLHSMSNLSWMFVRRMPNLRALFVSCGFGLVPLALASLSIFLVAAVIGGRQSSQVRLSLAISTSVLVAYYLFYHDMSVSALPVLLAVNVAVVRRNWLLALLISIAMLGLTVFALTPGKLYLGVLPSLVFFGAYAAEIWNHTKNAHHLLRSDVP